MPPARVVLYAATAGVFLMAARAALIEPVPLPFAAAACGAYLTLILCGVFFLRLRVFADAVVRGPAGARGVALTFDDGPDPVHTRAVLDALDAGGVTATFFVIGKKAEAQPELVKEIVARGHEVGLHSYAHHRLFALRSERWVKRDLERGAKVLETILGKRPLLFRPPIGHTNPMIARVVDAMDMTMVGWSVGARDGIRGAKPEAVAARVRAGLRDGAIVLMHDAAERGDYVPTAARALPEILEAVKEARLDVVPLARWLD
jgi:peptidoglycan/xylan/chitin deacetylase (PgdA/CDA1 family)